MSEAMDRVSHLRHLPLFPLPLVLLPGEIVPLHIFEDRYRRMMSDIGNDGGLFGITLFEPAGDLADRPETGTIGCVAEVRETQLLEDGRSNIVTFGLVRYRLHEYVDEGSPYLVGDVSYFEDDAVEPALVDPLADEVFDLFNRIAKAAFKMSGNRGRLPEIARTDAESFSFLASAAFNFENDLKYRLLEMTSTFERLSKLREILDKTVGQMEEGAEIQMAARTNGHSKKKIDL